MARLARMGGMQEIIGTYGAALSRLAMSYEADPALREDLLQEILLAIHRALPRLREQSRIAPYIFRIAHNRAVSHVALESGRKRMLAEEEQGGSVADPRTPETLVAEGERQRRLASAIRQLAIPYRQVIGLALEGLSYAEIAEALDISVSNVGVRLNRAKSMLKERLADG